MRHFEIESTYIEYVFPCKIINNVSTGNQYNYLVTVQSTSLTSQVSTTPNTISHFNSIKEMKWQPVPAKLVFDSV